VSLRTLGTPPLFRKPLDREKECLMLKLDLDEVNKLKDFKFSLSDRDCGEVHLILYHSYCQKTEFGSFTGVVSILEALLMMNKHKCPPVLYADTKDEILNKVYECYDWDGTLNKERFKILSHDSLT
jgi:hypothetical protein